MKAKKSSKSSAKYEIRKCTFCGILVELKNLVRHNLDVHSMRRTFKSLGNIEYDTDISASSEADSDGCNEENKVEKSNSDGQQTCQQSSQQSCKESCQESTDFNDGEKITVNAQKTAEKSTIDGQAQGDLQREKDKNDSIDSIDTDLVELQADRTAEQQADRTVEKQADHTVSTGADEFENKFDRPELSIEYDGEFSELVLSFRVKPTPKSTTKSKTKYARSLGQSKPKASKKNKNPKQSAKMSAECLSVSPFSDAWDPVSTNTFHVTNVEVKKRLLV